jgi:hypothetical protein
MPEAVLFVWSPNRKSPPNLDQPCEVGQCSRMRSIHLDITGFSETRLPCWPDGEQLTDNPFFKELL